MNIDVNTVLGIATGVITAVGGIYTGVRVVLASSRRKKEEYRQGILKQANESMARIKVELESKISAIEVELLNQKSDVSREFIHIKEVYNAEIKSLGQKVEELRQDLQIQHSSLVALLTRLVEK